MIPLSLIIGAEILIYGSILMISTIFLFFGCAKLKGVGKKPADGKPTTPATIPIPATTTPNTTTAIPKGPATAAPGAPKVDNTVSVQPTEDPDLKSRTHYDIRTTDETCASKVKTQNPAK
uniref:Uncharacterized protein n=1 Tax=Panagrolaimus sp. PS1159 TaxID=55785 RepID=A0AC35F821_9BILA